MRQARRPKREPHPTRATWRVSNRSSPTCVASTTDKLAALEERIQALQAATAAAATPVAAPPAPVPPPPTSQAAAGSSKVFNPDIAAIGDFTGAVGKTPGGGEPSLDLHEAEVSFQAVVDPYARADFFLTFGNEEVGRRGRASSRSRRCPGGFLMKVGKMRDAFGKVDGQHNHVLPFVDRPLVSQNLLGGEDALADAGISLARLIPNPWVFLEATGQVYRGESEVFKAPTRGDLAYVGHLRAYQDITESTNIDLGGSVGYGHNGETADSTTRLFGADATFRYRPLRRSIYTHLLGARELVWSRRQDALQTANAFGAYGYLEYQFGRRWFAGARYDYADRATNASLTDKGGSLILTYWPSEFSQMRGPVSPHPLRRRADRRRASLPVPLRHRRPRRPRLLVEVQTNDANLNGSVQALSRRCLRGDGRSIAPGRGQRHGQHRGPRRPHTRGRRETMRPWTSSAAATRIPTSSRPSPASS